MAELDMQPPSEEARPDPSDLTQDLFWEQYGHKFDPSLFPRKSFDTVWRFAEVHSADLEHHNFDHAKETLWVAMALVDYCERIGEPVDRIAVVLAALTHDNGFGEDYASLGFESEEEYAAALCEELAVSLDPPLPEITIDAAKQAIEDTTTGSMPETNESRIMVTADIYNVGEDYEDDFIPVTKKIWGEYERKCKILGEKVTEDGFIRDSIELLRGYLKNDLSFGPSDRRNWQKDALQNIERLNRELHTILRASIGSTVIRVIDRLPFKDKIDD